VCAPEPERWRAIVYFDDGASIRRAVALLVMAVADGPFLIDAREVGINHESLERLLLEVCRVLATRHPDEYHVACTSTGFRFAR
jgi:hypothetical protein